jgi:hypothetical protein
MRTASLGVALAVALGVSLAAESPPAVYVAPPPPTYQANVEARIADALVRARDENRRVLIQWGSNSDKASQELIQTMLNSPDVSRTLLYEYEVVRADISGSERAAAAYQANLQTGGFPYLTVLDAERKVLANQPAASFKTEGEGTAAYHSKKLNDFLKKYQAPYVNADLLFKSALAQAKKEQKTLFVWFSAPW